MSEEEESAAVLAAMAAITQTLNNVGDGLRALDKYGKRTRHITLALIISLVLDLALTATIGILASVSNSNSTAVHSEVQTIHEVQVSNCNIANQQRKDQVVLWHFFINVLEEPVPGAKPLTPAQKAHSDHQVAELLGFVDTTFATVKCPT